MRWFPKIHCVQVYVSGELGIHIFFFLELSRKWVVRIVKVGVGLLRRVTPAALFYGTFRSFSPRLWNLPLCQQKQMWCLKKVVNVLVHAGSLAVLELFNNRCRWKSCGSFLKSWLDRGIARFVAGSVVECNWHLVTVNIRQACKMAWWQGDFFALIHVMNECKREDLSR